MKWIAAVFCLLLGSYFSIAEAVSLKINPGINMLVLDGHKLPGSLLKGADSIELERGQHQILFTLDATAASTAYILTFSTQSHTVSMILPTPSEQQKSQYPQFRLVDENQHDIPRIQDHLPVPDDHDYLKAIAAYNLMNNKASVAKFSLAPSKSTLTSDNLPYSDRDTAQWSVKPTMPSLRKSLLFWLRDFRIS